MKVIIAGSRTINDYELLKDVIKNVPLEITEVVCGMARGVDQMGERWAKENGIPVKYFPADWTKHGKKAGFIRNSEMGDYAEALITITTGSNGTRNMIEYAKQKGLRVFVAKVNNDGLQGS